ncbi:HD domain-containing protein [Pseudonocardia spinosispora]|uniref:HD domain-containing protein n=1 Tax=Pseudonocardia spinosispora TaxID=103441 RepID=UPI000404229C|nr:HD domain-containing protein [Pseudonocardia spinosispora]
MSDQEIDVSSLPSNKVPEGEVAGSFQAIGQLGWVREPLDDAVAGHRRQVIALPAAATIGTPADGAKAQLLSQLDVPNTVFMMGDNPALPKMPEKPTLEDFFRLRFDSFNASHLLQSAKIAQGRGLDEKVVMACLLHDIAVAGLLSSSHGYWGAQMVAPYVDEEIAWAIEKHEALRYFADESVGYSYPDAYVAYFGPDYDPPAYIHEEYRAARKHRWYMTSRAITINDVYSFDPAAKVDFEELADVVGRHFRQPTEGLGFDGSPVAHMWRTMIWPNNFV